MFSVLNSSNDWAKVEKDVCDLLFTVTDRDTEALDEHLAKSDALQVYRMLQVVNKELASIKLENIILTDFLQKNDPIQLQKIDHMRKKSTESRRSSGFQDIQKRKSSSIGSGKVSPTLFRINSRTASTADSGFKHLRKIPVDFHINYKTKCEFAEKLAAEVQQKCAALQKQGIYDIKTLKAHIEELQYRTADTEETLKTFKVQFLQNDFLANATDRQRESYFRKFINIWLRNGRAMLGTMRLKITSIQEHCHQQRTALISKADLSAMLGAVDFQQLQIKREMQSRSLEEKNISIAGLKEASAKATSTLGNEKKNLMALEQKSKVLQEKTNDIGKGITKLEQESKNVEKELDLAMDALRTLKIQVEEYVAPSINDYIFSKQEILALEKEQKLLERKSYIQNIKYQNLLRKLKSQN